MIRSWPIEDVFLTARDTGYDYLELSWREEFFPSRRGRQPSLETIQRLNRASQERGVSIASIMTIYEWSSSDEITRQESVRYFKTLIQAAADLGCSRINTEFSGDRFNSLASERAFLRSAEELVPVLEEMKVKIYIEPHPNDFVENGEQAAHIIRGLHSDMFGYLFCAPHTFYLGGTLEDQIQKTQDVLGHVHLADTFKPSRVILNPIQDVRIHEHLDIGQGEIDWRVLFGELAKIGYDDILSVVVFAWPDRPVDSFRKNREQLSCLLKEAGIQDDY